MKFTRNGSVHVIAGLIAGAGALAFACGSDEESTGNTPAPDGGSTSSGGSSSGTTSSSGTASSSGSTSTDGGTDAASEGGGGTKNPGEDCNDDNECKSGKCLKGDYCTITCTMKEQADPACKALGGDFSGDCNKQGLCEKQ